MTKKKFRLLYQICRDRVEWVLAVLASGGKLRNGIFYNSTQRHTAISQTLTIVEENFTKNIDTVRRNKILEEINL